MGTKVENIASQLAAAANIKNIWGDLVINIKDFGAVGDGVSDDTAAIQKAIEYAISIGGGEVFIPRDSAFGFSGNLYLKSNVALVGTDRQTAVLKALTNDSNIFLHDVENVRLDNFKLDCNGKKSRIAVEALTADVKRITLNDLSVVNGGNISDSGSWTNNVQVKRWGEHNVFDVWINGLYCEGAASDGRNVGDNLIIESYGSDGTGTLQNVVISNCIFKRSGRNNLSLAGDNTVYRPDYITISNVICEDSSLAGIDFEEVNKVSLSNVHCIRNGQYTAYYNGTHFAQTFPNSIMRSGFSLHGANNAVAVNCIFDECYYGLGGFGPGLNVSNSKFFNSRITNGDLSAAGRWLISNCDISGSGATVNYLVSNFLGRIVFSHCNFSGTTSTGYMVQLISDGSSDTYYRENSFNNCVFIGQSDRSMNAFYIQFGWYKFSNNIINNFGTVFKFYQNSTLAQVDIGGNQIRKCNLIVDAGYISLFSLDFSQNYCELIKQVAKFNTQTRDVFFTDNVMYLDLNTSDGFTHIGIEFPSTCGVKNLQYVGNYMRNTGTATDVEGCRFNVRSQEVATDTLAITDNAFASMNSGFSLNLFSASNQATNAIIKNNQGKSVTTLISSFAGVDPNKSIVADNLNEGALVSTVYPRRSGTTAQRPTNVLSGYTYYDTTTTSLVTWNGSSWV